MKTFLVSLAFLLALPGLCRGQASGNVAYAEGGGGKVRAQQAERNKRNLTKEEMPPTGTSTFVEANVLMNVKADVHVAVFGIAREAETVAECNAKVDATVKAFTDALKPLGVAAGDFYVDFVAQNKVYGFEITGDIAREKLVGFELKKNVSVRFKDIAALDRFVIAAAGSQVYDLVKVDYVVTDPKAVHARLMKEAARVLKEKKAGYEDLLGIKLIPPAQVYADRVAVHYPTGLYDAYTAQESEGFSNANAYRQKYNVQSARKGRTFFFNGLDANGFDEVIDPVVVEPVVQFTLYLKIKYEVEQVKAK